MQKTIQKISVCCWFCLGLFSLLSAQSGVLDNIKDQQIAPTESFEPINVADFILPSVTCSTIEVIGIRKQGTDNKPTTTCAKTNAYHSTMSALVQLKYGPDGLFNHAEDYLMFYNDKDEIVECGNVASLMKEDILLKEGVYNLSINGGSAKYAVRMVFYSGADQQLYERDSIFQYLQNKRMGKIGTPYVLDFAPITMTKAVDNSLLLTPVIQDTAFIGQVCYQIKVTDCDNGQTGMDEVCFTIGVDTDCRQTHTLNTELFTSLAYKAATTIVADNVIHVGADVTYQAGDSITLKLGFEVKAGATFLAKIASCVPVEEVDALPNTLPNLEQIRKSADQAKSTEADLFLQKQAILKIHPNPVAGHANLRYYLPNTGAARLNFVDVQGSLIQQINLPEMAVGWQVKTVNISDFSFGIYFVILETNQQLIYQKMLIR